MGIAPVLGHVLVTHLSLWTLVEPPLTAVYALVLGVLGFVWKVSVLAAAATASLVMGVAGMVAYLYEASVAPFTSGPWSMLAAPLAMLLSVMLGLADLALGLVMNVAYIVYEPWNVLVQVCRGLAAMTGLLDVLSLLPGLINVLDRLSAGLLTFFVVYMLPQPIISLGVYFFCEELSGVGSSSNHAQPSKQCNQLVALRAASSEARKVVHSGIPWYALIMSVWLVMVVTHVRDVSRSSSGSSSEVGSDESAHSSSAKGGTPTKLEAAPQFTEGKAGQRKAQTRKQRR